MGVGATESNYEKCMHVHANAHTLVDQASSIVNTEQEADLQGSPGDLLHPKIN